MTAFEACVADLKKIVTASGFQKIQPITVMPVSSSSSFEELEYWAQVGERALEPKEYRTQEEIEFEEDYFADDYYNDMRAR